MIGINGVINFDLSKEKDYKKFAESETKKMNNPKLLFNKINENGIFLHLFNNDQKPLFHRYNHIDIYILGDIFIEQNKETFSAIFDFIKKKKDRELCNLNGIYSIIVINYLEKSISIYLDDNSLIPVYFKQINNSLYISWNIFALSNSNSNSKVNYENLFSWLLIGGRGFNSDTRYKDIKRLEPGANIRFFNNKINIIKINHFALSLLIIPKINF